jgi:hypothetical protein
MRRPLRSGSVAFLMRYRTSCHIGSLVGDHQPDQPLLPDDLRSRDEALMFYVGLAVRMTARPGPQARLERTNVQRTESPHRAVGCCAERRPVRSVRRAPLVTVQRRASNIGASWSPGKNWPWAKPRPQCPRCPHHRAYDHRRFRRRTANLPPDHHPARPQLVTRGYAAKYMEPHRSLPFLIEETTRQ